MNAGLNIVLSMRDGFSPVLRRAGKSAEKFGQSTDRSFNKASKSVLSYTKLVGSILTAKVLSRGFAYAEMGIRSLSQSIVGADQALVNASAKFGEGVVKGSDAYEELNRTAREIGATTEYTVKQTAEALDFLAMAGFNYQQSIAVIRPMTDLATASQMDFAEATDMASDALGAFRLSTDPVDIERNLSRITDVFARTATTRNVTLTDIRESMKKGAASTTLADQDVETFAAIAGELGGANIKGTRAGTGIYNMMKRVTEVAAGKTGGQQGRAFAKMGVNLRNEDGTEVRDMISIIEDISKYREDAGLSSKAVISDAFGARALPAVEVLTSGEVIGRLREYRDSMYEAEGATKKMADTMRGGLSVQLKILESTATSKGMDIFQGIMGGKDPADSVKKLVDTLRDFDVKPIIGFLRQAGSVVKDISVFLYEIRGYLFGIAKIMLLFRATKLSLGVLGGLQRGALSLGGKFAPKAAGSLSRKSGILAAKRGAGSAAMTGASSLALGKGIGVAGIASTVAGVLGAAGVGVALGFLINKYIKIQEDKKLAEDNASYKRGLGWNDERNKGKITDLSLRRDRLAFAKDQMNRFGSGEEADKEALATWGMRAVEAKQALSEALQHDKVVNLEGNQTALRRASGMEAGYSGFTSDEGFSNLEKWLRRQEIKDKKLEIALTFASQEGMPLGVEDAKITESEVSSPGDKADLRYSMNMTRMYAGGSYGR